MCDKNDITLQRFRKLIDKSYLSRQSIAEKIGCDVSTITKQYNGDRKITTDYIVKYANYFEVSADYLLGLSDVPTTDKDVQFICDYTGLDLGAVMSLKTMKDVSCSLLQPVNLLFDSGEMSTMVYLIIGYLGDIKNQLAYLDKAVENLKEGKADISLYKRCVEFSNKADLNLFKLQETIKDFVKEHCKKDKEQIKLLSEEYKDLVQKNIGVLFEELNLENIGGD